MLLSASLIAADFGKLEAQAREALEAGVDWLHVDVMDGHFVPNLTAGALVVEALRPLCDETGALLDVHLMVTNPDDHLERFARAGADVLTVHVEACPHLHRTIQRIKELDVYAGVTLNPATPLSAIEEILPMAELVLIMSVNPGFSGQDYIPLSTDKIIRMRRMLNAVGSTAHLEVDGGIKPENAMEVTRAGASILVAGSALFGGPRSIAENVAAFRQAVLMRA